MPKLLIQPISAFCMIASAPPNHNWPPPIAIQAFIAGQLGRFQQSHYQGGMAYVHQRLT